MGSQDETRDPIFIDGKFTDVSDTGGYKDEAMAAAFQRAGILPESFEKKDNSTTPETPTINEEGEERKTEITTEYLDTTATKPAENKQLPDYYIKALQEAQRKSQGRVDARKKEREVINTNIPKPSTPQQNIEAKKEEDMTLKDKIKNLEKRNKDLEEKIKKMNKLLNHKKVRESVKIVEEEQRHQQELDRNKERNKNWRPYSASDGILRMEEDAKKAIKENEEFKRRFTYIDKEGQEVEIPLPIREEMKLILNEKNQVFNPEIAHKYAIMENELYNRKIQERIDSLRQENRSEEYINSYIDTAKKEIKIGIQQYVKGTVTRDFRDRVIKRILEEPEKYKDYIDSTTGKVIKSIDDENIIGYILGQKVYPRWMKGEIEAIEKTDIVREEKPKNLKKWAIIAGAVGFGTAVLGGATVGGYAVLGGAIVSGTAALAKFIGKKRIESLTTQMKKASGEDKAIIEKKLKTWNKIRNIAESTMKIAGGFTTGAGIGNAISNIFFGGEGLINVLQRGKEVAQVTQAGSATNLKSTTRTPSFEGVTTQSPVENIATQATIENTNGILVQNGRVNLPNSPWHTNLGGKHIANWPGGALNHSNYTGGMHEQAAHMVEEALKANSITRDALLNNLGPSGTTELLNNFLRQIQQGIGKPSLTNALRSLSSAQIEGADALLNMVKP
ncbi:MAG: hypothetical protein ACOX0R_02865 [Candidatus Dojkabacteria bacterium]|jgi:hypothetical protein